MYVDVDANEGGDCYIYQLGDDRFGLIVWVPKSGFAEARRSVRQLPVGGEAVLGTIGSGQRVWVTRHESGYAIAIGDTDSKDVWISLSKQEVAQLIETEASTTGGFI